MYSVFIHEETFTQTCILKEFCKENVDNLAFISGHLRHLRKSLAEYFALP